MKRGEVWLVNLDPTIGAEIKKSRPCVIVNQNALASLPLKIIVPLTTWNDQFEHAAWHVRIMPTRQNGLKSESSADTFQVRSISEKRLVKKFGELSPEVLEGINQAISISLALD
ncbi:MAG TPA: type II toxin-antitoxin system PemK/MazF family toxin [Chloroflexi bacterium]|nr:type II toxin-antitoxin system PemK/MazF family toxin [Chloroflexota bacterium]